MVFTDGEGQFRLGQWGYGTIHDIEEHYAVGYSTHRVLFYRVWFWKTPDYADDPVPFTCNGEQQWALVVPPNIGLNLEAACIDHLLSTVMAPSGHLCQVALQTQKLNASKSQVKTRIHLNQHRVYTLAITDVLRRRHYERHHTEVMDATLDELTFTGRVVQAYECGDPPQPLSNTTFQSLTVEKPDINKDDLVGVCVDLFLDHLNDEESSHAT